MKKVEQLYEGKAKKVYSTEDPNVVIVSYKDDATAFDGLKKGTITGKMCIRDRLQGGQVKDIAHNVLPPLFHRLGHQKCLVIRRRGVLQQLPPVHGGPHLVLPQHVLHGEHVAQGFYIRSVQGVQGDVYKRQPAGWAGWAFCSLA